MTKIFNTLQELWNYSSFCPFCFSNNKKIDISVGPDGVFNLIEFVKLDHHLELKTLAKINIKRYYINFNINCLDNSFDVKIFEQSEEDLSLAPTTKATSPYFYFYWTAYCQICSNSHLDSSDMELDFLNKKIFTLGIENEIGYFIGQEDKYKVSINYKLETMNICRFYPHEKENYSLGPTFSCPMSKIDFSNQQKAVARIRTILLFS